MLKHFRFVAQEINPSELGIIINKVDIIIVAPNRGWYRTPHIGKTRLKGLVDTLVDLG